MNRRPIHITAVRFAERILTSKSFKVTSGTDSDLLVNDLVKVNVKSCKIEENRESFSFRIGNKNCDLIMCLGMGERNNSRQQIVVYIMPVAEITDLKNNIRIPVSGNSIYAPYFSRFDLIDKIAKKKGA